jgi:glutamate-1-semialdehyde 2,1-aminomutase
MMKNGILTLGTHLMSYAQSDEHIDRLIAAYADFLARLKTGLEEGSLRDMLDCEPLEPLFKVRQA